MTQRPLRLTAGWAYPIDSPPIQNAAILIGADGRIVAVGSDERVPPAEGADTIDFPGAALLPGFVNTHTHLELTGLGDSAPEDRFPEWILTIRRLKESRSAEEFLEAARKGIRDCWTAGVTTIADTGDTGTVIQALSEVGGSGVVYQEVFGPHPDHVDQSLAELTARVGELRGYQRERIRLGVSPHAPYTVSGPLYRRTVAYARSEGLPLAVHIAESPEETEFVTRGSGPFAEAWTARGIPLLDHPSHWSGRPRSARPSSPVRWLDDLGALTPDTLCIHAVQLLPEDIGLLAKGGVSIAHCPVSNARHRHGAAPLGALRRAGIRVGLGTDSVASIGRIDMFAELLAAQALSGLNDQEALALATLEGARALGLEGQIGTLTPGKWADVIAVQHPPVQPYRGPIPTFPTVLLTVVGGRVVFQA